MKLKVLVFPILLISLYPLLFRWTKDKSLCFAEAPDIIKFATIAPEGSTWVKVLDDVDKELAEGSGNRLRLKIYAGGVQGDDNDVSRKMRIGQLHSGSLMTTALGQILPEARICELPFCFSEYNEIDFVKSKMKNKLSQAFKDKGYILLGWTEVGFIYFFSNIPINSISDLRSTKMWMWEGDLLAKALFDSIDLSPIPLSIIDVMTSLQTGLIDSVYASPLSVIAFQWFSRLKYMLEVPILNPTVAILITKKRYDKLSSGHQEILRSVFKKHEQRLTQLIRDDNRESIEILKRSGIKIIAQKNAMGSDELNDIGTRVRQSLDCMMFTNGLVENVMEELESYRKSNKQAN